MKHCFLILVLLSASSRPFSCNLIDDDEGTDIPSTSSQTPLRFPTTLNFDYPETTLNDDGSTLPSELSSSTGESTEKPTEESNTTAVLTTDDSSISSIEVTTESEEITTTYAREAVESGATAGKRKPVTKLFPLLMLALGLLAIVVGLALIAKRSFRGSRRYNALRDLPMSFANPIYDVALASLRDGSEGIALAEDALSYEHQRQPLPRS